MAKLEIKCPLGHLDEMFTDAIQTYGGGKLTVTGPTATAGIFSTYPADYLSMWGGVVDQVVPLITVLGTWIWRACKSRRVTR